MALPTPKMRLVTQADAGDKHWDDCVPASAAMAVRRATNLEKLPTWRQIRAELEKMGIHDEPNKSNGTRLSDNVTAVKRLYGIEPVKASNPKDYDTFLAQLSKPARGAVICGLYSKLPAKWRKKGYESDTRAAFGHAIYVEFDPETNKVAVFDPLRAKDSAPKMVPAAEFKAFAISYGNTTADVGARVYEGTAPAKPAPAPAPAPVKPAPVPVKPAPAPVKPAPIPVKPAPIVVKPVKPINKKNAAKLELREVLKRLAKMRWSTAKRRLWIRVEQLKKIINGK